MKKHMKKVLRNPLTDILLIVGFVIACFILMNVAELVSKILIEEQETKGYLYEAELSVWGENSDDKVTEQIAYIEGITVGNVFLKQLVNINNGQEQMTANLIICANEDLGFDFQKGGYPTDDVYENAVIIGESLEKYVFEENENSYIYLWDKKYHVTGVLENKMSGGIDTSLYVFWDTITEESKTYFFEWGLETIIIKSQEELSYLKEEIQNFIMECGMEVEERDSTYEGDYRNYWHQLYGKIFLTIGFVFSLCTSFCISYLWFWNRKREMAIRIAYGYSRGQIFVLVFKDVLKLMVPAFLVALVVQFLYGAIVGEPIALKEMMLEKLIVIFGGMLAVVLLNAIYVVRKLGDFSANMINTEE